MIIILGSYWYKLLVTYVSVILRRESEVRFVTQKIEVNWFVAISIRNVSSSTNGSMLIRTYVCKGNFDTLLIKQTIINLFIFLGHSITISIFNNYKTIISFNWRISPFQKQYT